MFVQGLEIKLVGNLRQTLITSVVKYGFVFLNNYIWILSNARGRVTQMEILLP